MLDPFVGYGSLARECSSLGLNFTGFDINPTAIRLSKFLAATPSSSELSCAFSVLESECKSKIISSYKIDGTDVVATHYLWEVNELKEVWTSGPRRKRIISTPSSKDLALFHSFDHYDVKHIRPVQIFDNSRINAKSSLDLTAFFTQRALRNIDILLQQIHAINDATLRDAFLLSLTSAIGQMSRMVFAISGRGKMQGTQNGRVEVGSWVIGYWRPKLHFEINVWNCFERRVRKLISACQEVETAFAQANDLGSGSVCLRQGDSLDLLLDVSDGSVDLIITDPPHGDRIPYLELSELWNAILQEDVDFDNEIIVSNAKGRGKTAADYKARMEGVFAQLRRVLKPGGLLIVLFNSRKDADWDNMTSIIDDTSDSSGVEYIGCFDCAYSAGSVVQDNRSGGLKSDFGLVFGKVGCEASIDTTTYAALASLPAWSTNWPQAVRNAE